MKRFILFFFMLLCTLTSAVAESTAFGTDNLSSYEVDGTTVTVTIGTAGDLSTLVSTTWNSGSATPSEVASSTKVIISGPINSSDAGVLYAFTGATTYDLRNATFGENVGSSIVVENSKSNVIVIVPGGTTTTVLATYNASNIGLYASYSNGNKDLSVYFPTTITAETAALINSSIKSDVENLNIEGDVRANITIDVSGLEYVNLIHITDSYNTAYSITLSGSATNVIASNGGIHTYWEDSKQISAPYITYTAAQVKNLIVIDTTNHQVTATIANDGNLSEALQLVDMLAVTSLTVVGKATTTDAANLATLAPALERLDLKQADVTATEFNALNVPATLKSMVVPAGTTMTTSFKSLLQSNFSQLDYVYSPSTDQTTTDVPDIVFVCQAGGLKEAFDNESGVKTALYLKVDSYTELNQADLTLNSYSPKKYEYLEFTDAKLSKTTVSDLATSASSNLYRVILPEGWTGEDMATFNGVSTSPSDYRLAAYYSYSGNAPYRTLNILGLSNSYSTTALTNTPMIKDGIFAVNFVSGEYNSNTYGTFTTTCVRPSTVQTHASSR